MTRELRSDAIGKVKEAEAKAVSVARAVEEESKKIILDAKLDSQEMIYWNDAEAKAAAKKIIEEASAAMKRELARVSQNAVKEKEALEAKAASCLEKAVNFITEKAIRIYGGSETK